MAFFGCGFGTQQSHSIRPRCGIQRFWNLAIAKKPEEGSLVARPVLRFAIGMKQLRSRSQQWLMKIADPCQFLQKELQIGVFSETGKLAAAVQTDVDQQFDAFILEQREK